MFTVDLNFAEHYPRPRVKLAANKMISIVGVSLSTILLYNARINLLFYLLYPDGDNGNHQYHNKQEQYRETKKSYGQVEDWGEKKNALDIR